MGYGYGGWAPYVPVAERRRKAGQEMEKLRKKGHPVSPVLIAGRTIASTFWGKAWCANLESYRDYENRLPRGRTYVRNGSVVDLQISPLAVTAMVSGSSIYKVSITIAAVPKAQWQSICQDCSGGIDSLVELLQGRLSKAVMERLCRQDRGLFPKPAEIQFKCSCPDSASMCKHIAATLYGVGSRLDDQPELLFWLRSVNEKELVPALDRALPLSKSGPAAGKVLDTDDLSALFGLDLMEGDAVPEPVAPKPVAGKALATKKPGTKAAAKPTAALKMAKKVNAAKPVALVPAYPDKPTTAVPILAASKASNHESSPAKLEATTPPSKKLPSALSKRASPQMAKPRSKSHRRKNTVWDQSDIYNNDD